jgi:hypothetical protein
MMPRLPTPKAWSRRPQTILVGQLARPLCHPLLFQALLPIPRHPGIPQYSPRLSCLQRMECCSVSTRTAPVNPVSCPQATSSIRRSSKVEARRRQIDAMTCPAVMPRTATWALQVHAVTVAWAATKSLSLLLPKGLQRDPAGQLLLKEARMKTNRTVGQRTTVLTSPLPPPCLRVVRHMPRSVRLSSTTALQRASLVEPAKMDGGDHTGNVPLGTGTLFVLSKSKGISLEKERTMAKMNTCLHASVAKPRPPLSGSAMHRGRDHALPGNRRDGARMTPRPQTQRCLPTLPLRATRNGHFPMLCSNASETMAQRRSNCSLLGPLRVRHMVPKINRQPNANYHRRKSRTRDLQPERSDLRSRRRASWDRPASQMTQIMTPTFTRWNACLPGGGSTLS